MFGTHQHPSDCEYSHLSRLRLQAQKTIFGIGEAILKILKEIQEDAEISSDPPEEGKQICSATAIMHVLYDGMGRGFETNS